MNCENCIHDCVCMYDGTETSANYCSFYEEVRQCNQCRYYEGVHGVQGHAPCSFWGIGGVLSSDYCSRYEKEGGQNEKD